MAAKKRRAPAIKIKKNNTRTASASGAKARVTTRRSKAIEKKKKKARRRPLPVPKRTAPVKQPTKPASAKKARVAPTDPIALVETALAALGADFRAFSCKKDPPTSDDVVAAERAVGRSFPPDYRRFLERWGSLVLDVAPDVWRRPVELEVRPSWQMDYARVVFGIAPQPEWVRVDAQHKALVQRRGPGFLPVMRRLSGNGDIYGYSEDDEFLLLAHDTGQLEPSEPFFETLIAEIQSLHEGRERLRTSPIPPG